MARASDSQKLKELARIEGYTDMQAFLRHCATDSVVPGICVYCDYSVDVEPDSTRGWCEECQTNTVRSALVLAGLI